MPLGTPYVTPALLLSAPTGVSWKIIPAPGASQAQTTAELTNIAWRATGIVDSYCNQILRATIDTEQQSGPDFRITLDQATGTARVILQRWPVTQILAIQVAPNATFPRQWTPVPAGAFDVEYPTVGLYGSSTPSSAGEGGQSILIGPGYVGWGLGRRGWRVSVTYLNGWPHTALTAPAPAGSSTVTVDDVTGWGLADVGGFTGASGFLYDGSSTETVAVTATAATSPLTLPNNGGLAQAGPGTMTLAAPLTYEHPAGVMLSALPANIVWATILAAMVQALEGGIQAVTIQNLPGSMTTGGHGVRALQTQYQALLTPYQRMI